MKKNRNHFKKRAEFMNMDKYDVIIVGAGLAGLTSAAYLTKYEKKVLVLEQFKDVGGYFRKFTEKGYTFDSGIKAIEDGGILKGVIKTLDLENKVQLHHSITGMMFPDKLIALYSRKEINHYFTHLQEKFPEDAHGIKEIMKFVRDISGLIDAFQGMSNILFGKNILSLLFTPFYIIRHLRFFMKVGIMKKTLNTDLIDFLRSHVHNENLVKLLSQKFFDGTPAFFGLGYSQIFLDYYYPTGGMQSITDALAFYVTQNGNEILTESKVENLIIEDGKVKGVVLSDGERIFSKVVVYAGDGFKLYKNIIPAHYLSEKQKHQLNKARPCESNFSLFLGLNMPTEALPFNQCGHVFYNPNYIGTTIQDRYINPNYFKLTSQEISIPTIYDPYMAPSDKSVLNISVVAVPEYNNYWNMVNGQRTPEYNQLKNNIADDIIDNLEKIIPNIRDRIEVKITASPFTNQDYTMNIGGSITGWSQNPDHTFNKKSMMDMKKMIETPIQNLYHVGQWSFTPGGAPTCMLGGVFSAEAINKQLK
ncbi:MAG: NAD(P)/FAD-dependent oxidoreductase [Candidatus Lokiarchaeota archaeon]|nr:NAD(P)/FAD-dependent oxidoreductase [Candidatus Lokiarchaeota archaeon]